MSSTVCKPGMYDIQLGGGYAEWVTGEQGICLVQKVVQDGLIKVSTGNIYHDVRFSMVQGALERNESGLSAWFMGELRVIGLTPSREVNYRCDVAWDSESRKDPLGRPLVQIFSFVVYNTGSLPPVSIPVAYEHARGALMDIQDTVLKACGCLETVEDLEYEVLVPVNTPWDVLD